MNELEKEIKKLKKENTKLKFKKIPIYHRWKKATDEDRKKQGAILKKARLKKYSTLTKEQKSALMKAVRNKKSFSDLYKVFLYENDTKKN